MEKMASSYDNVQVSILSDDERFVHLCDEPVKLDLSRQSETANLYFTKGKSYQSHRFSTKNAKRMTMHCLFFTQKWEKSLKMRDTPFYCKILNKRKCIVVHVN